MKKIKLLIAFFWAFNCQGDLFSQPKDCRWIGPSSGGYFDTLSNWAYDDYSNYPTVVTKNPTAISSDYNFTIENASLTLVLSANCVVNDITFKEGKLDFNGKELTINGNTRFYNYSSPATFDTSVSGSKIIY